MHQKEACVLHVEELVKVFILSGIFNYRIPLLLASYTHSFNILFLYAESILEIYKITLRMNLITYVQI